MNTNTKRITNYITALISVVVLVCIDQFTKYLACPLAIHFEKRPVHYITYRYKRALVRKSNSTDEQILLLVS